MDKNRELVLRIADAENDVFNSMNSIMQVHNLPFFLFEPIIDKVHKQLIDGKMNEIEAAKQREKQSNLDGKPSETTSQKHRPASSE